MKAIISVIGKDKVGIIAGVSAELAKFNINILNINQTIVEEYFTMIMLVNVAESSLAFDKIKSTLNQKGQDLGVKIKIQREEIFNSMHKL